ncbi:MAG: hypothetical protein JOY66_25200 [Acetobacteraceae bacterium]|nr:hypothetical protein [Acetobacteraceae bacterium]
MSAVYREAPRQGHKATEVMSNSSDIVHDLEQWLSDADPHSRHAEFGLIRRAIDEINALREQLGQRRASVSIETEALNASNDE